MTKYSKRETGGVPLQGNLFLKILQYSRENTCVGVSFYQSCKPSGLQFYQIQTTTQVFSCECGEIFKITYSEKYLRTAVSHHQGTERSVVNIPP